MKKSICMLLLLLAVGLIVSCDNTKDSDISMEDLKPEKLVVYGVGDEVQTNYGEHFFTTRYLLGEFQSMAEKWGESGYIYYNAISEYEKNTGIDIELHLFSNTQDLLAALMNESKLKPDIIIGSYTSGDYCLYPYIESGLFADLKSYFEEDEIYTDGEYISKVIEAGMIGDQQLIFPLTFNMNVLFSSMESMLRHEFWLSDDMKYEDFISVFQDNWGQMNREEEECLLIQYTNMWNDYPYVLLQAASGVSLIDYETGIISIDKEYFNELAKLYESYLCNDYGMTREELKELADINQGFLPSDLSYYNELTSKVVSNEIAFDVFELLNDRIAFIAEGGNTSYLLHSFASQAYYYNSRYKDLEEEFICVGIPAKGKEGFAAQVTTFGAVLDSSPYTKYGYEFLKSLADSQKYMFFDLSVNKRIATNTINNMASTYYNLYPSLGNFPPEREPEGEDWLGEAYIIQPLSEKTKEYLLEMIEKITVAVLPEWSINNIVTQEIESYIYGDTSTIDEAYKKVTQQLNNKSFK